VNQIHCNDSIFTMAANKPTEFGAYGAWTVVGKPTWATITDTTLNTTKVKVLAGHTATLVWTISNGTCAATTDTVLLTNYDVPAVAKANVDQLHCNDSIFTMAANKPTEYGAKGIWSVVGKPTWVTVTDTTLNTTKVKVLAGHTATLIWTISNGTCAATTDTVLLTNYDVPAVAKANVNQLHCNDSIFTMAANKPTEYGAYGAWTVVGKPTWVTVTDTTLNTTKVKVLAGHTATMVWTISNGTCAATTDTVLLTNYDVPAVAKANVDQLHCNDSIFTMAANKPTEYGANGAWTVVGKPTWVTITDTTLNTTKVKVLAGHTATLVWTISNGTCAATTDTVLLTNYDVPAIAKANVDQLHCNDSIFTMAANKPTEYGASGTWTVVGKPTWVTVTDTTLNTTKVKVLAGHTATLVWTITNGTCAATTDTVLLTNYDVPAVAKANVDQLHCNDSIFTMAANKPTEYGAYGAWTVVGKPTWATITDTTLNNTKVKVLAGHTATMVWTISNGTCAATTDTVLLTNYDVPAVAKANVDQLHCNDSIFTMAANKPTEYGAKGIWSVVGKPTWVTVTDTTLNTTKVKVLAGHTATLVWTISNGTCAATTDTVLLTNYDVPAVAKANVDQLHCNDSIFTMAANEPTEYGANGTWTVVGKPTWVTVTDTALNTTKVKVLAGHTATLVWTITNGTCAATTDTVLLTNYDVPAVAKAGINQIHCNDSIFTMAANQPTEYGAKGTWSVVGKPTWATITDTTLNTTKVKVLAGHTATLVWTISNGTCAATTDTVLLTNYDVPAVAKANIDQLHCNDSIFTMAANKPTEYGAKGTWSVVGKPTWVTVTDTTLNTTQVKVLAGHTATLVWTITNGTCAATTDTVLLTNYDVPAVAKANIDQLHCNDSIFTMAANQPTEYGAKGTWSVVGKPIWATITDTTLNTTKVKVLAGHTATLVWTISNGTCAATTDTVLLTNYDVPAVAKANVNQLHCNDSIFTMAANKPTEYGAKGTWSVVGKPTWVTVTDTTLNTTKVKVLAGHTATLVWTISNGTCAATTDTVLLTNYDVPAVAKANMDQLHCNDSIFTMAANKPTEYGAYGAWTVVGKPTWVTVTDTTLNTTKVKVLAGHTATLVWTISNGTCAATTDTVLLTNYDVPAVAKAGINQLHCNDSIFTMAANKPTEYGAKGTWSVVGKPIWATITDTTLNTTKVKVLAGHTATLVWTISNGTCAATTDTVLLTNYDVPAVAKANIDQLHCNDSIFTMAANKPTEYGAKGTWTVVGKPTWVTVTDTTLNTTKVKVLAGHTATLVWTISNGTCAATTDTVLLTNYDVPAVAKANMDQLHCNDSIFTMAANQPTEYGAKGTWSVVGKPTWATITDTTLNTTKVKVLAGHTATLVWTISNGTCAATTDTVLLTNYDVPAVAKANIDQLHCNDSIFTMAANKPTEYGAKGTWSVVGKPTWVTVTDTTLNTTKVKVLAGHTATLVWTISNGTCAATTDTVLLTNYDVPAVAKANIDQLHCNDSIFTMAANKPTEYGAKGIWSVVGKPTWVTVTDTTLNTTKVKVLAGHTATLVWTISNGTCAATTDTVLLTNYDVPAVAKANIDQLHCNDSIFTMAANKPTEYGAKGTWSVVGKPTWVTVTDTTLNTTKVKVLAGHTATLVWTISNGTCAATTDTVLLTNYDVPAVAKANIDQLHCNDSIFTMAANKPTEYGAKGTWSVVGKPTWVTVTDTTLNTTKVKVLAGHTATLVWTISNGTCAATTDTVLLTNYDVPAVAKANIDQLHCNDSIFTMAANKPTEYGAKGTWSVVGKPTWVTVTDTTLNTTKVKVLAGHTATLVWTISNGTCAATTDTVLLTNYDVPAVAKANIDQLHCNDSIFTMAANKPTEYGAKGTWSVVGKPTWVTVTDTTLNTTKVKVLAGHTATLVWTISNGTCAATTDTVLLTNYDVPAVAKANMDQLHCNDSIFTMAANRPTEYGAKGTWSVVGKPTTN
ncbi:hypothetical protein, partial [Chitinophaga sp. RAB17]|uniref:hypothetical protein n=1 Tax=Chitinophaga sp. RAB17 TaxID=3233049 RepID=UPI003F8EF3CD